MDHIDHTYSLKELALIIDGACDEMFTELFVRCKAEVAQIKQYGERSYISLVQVDKSGQIIEKTTGIIRRKSILEAFLKHTGWSTQELVGQEIMFQCNIKGSMQYGFSLSIHSLSKEFSKGKQVELKDQIREKLKKSGIYGLNKQHMLEVPPLRIAVISSEQSAGYEDFVSVCTQSGRNIQIELFPATVHGNEAATSVCTALEHIEGNEGFSLICIVRGGGGKEGFARQDNELLVEKVCKNTLPILVAVGHTQDTSLLDEVCRGTAKTPTDAAWIVVEEYTKIYDKLTSMHDAIQSSIHQRETKIRENIYRRWETIQAFSIENQLRTGYFVLQTMDGEYVSASQLKTIPAGTSALLIGNGIQREIRL